MIDSRLSRGLSLKQLRLLCLLAEERHLSHAALRLHTSQPAVSRLLAQTEATVGHRLFDRSTKRVVPTAAGSRLVHHAQRVLAELERAEHSLQTLGEDSRVELRVGMLSTFSQPLLGQALVDLQARMPSVVVRVNVQPAHALYDQLLEGSIDLMLSHVELPVDLNRVDVLPLYDEHSLVLAAPGSELARRRRPSWQELARHAWVLPTPGTPLRPKLDRMLSLHRSRDFAAGDVETDSAPLAVQLVQNSPMLWATASRHAAFWLGLGAVATVHTPQELVKGPFCCLRLHAAAESMAARRLVDGFRALARKPVQPRPEA